MKTILKKSFLKYLGIGLSFLALGCAKEYRNSMLPLDFVPTVAPRSPYYQELEVKTMSTSYNNNDVYVGYIPEKVYVDPDNPNRKTMPNYQR